MLVDEAAVKTVNRAKDTGRNVCAVGTTVMRAIESAVSTDGHLKEFEGWTNKFIFPPYEFTVANSMISNFHMPLSTLLMIVAAFGGYEQVMDAYHVALKEGYRFGTYGDAMLILESPGCRAENRRADRESCFPVCFLRYCSVGLCF